MPSPAVATPSPSTPPVTSSTAPGETDRADCTNPLAWLFAPPSGRLPGVRAFLETYPTAAEQSNSLLRVRGVFADPDPIRTVTWSSLSPVGEAARLCLLGPFSLHGAQADIERSRGCFLAIRGEWERATRVAGTPDAAGHLENARMIWLLADGRLEAKGRQWLQGALERELPLVEAVPEDWWDRPEVSTPVSSNAFLRRRQRPTSASAFLRAIRDAQSLDRVYVPGEMSTDGWYDAVGGSMSGNGTPDFRHGDRIVSVSEPAMCVRAARTEPKGIHASDGVQFAGGGYITCWQVVQALWRAYEATGSERYLDAVSVAWDYFRSRSKLRPGTPAWRKHIEHQGGL